MSRVAIGLMFGVALSCGLSSVGMGESPPPAKADQVAELTRQLDDGDAKVRNKAITQLRMLSRRVDRPGAKRRQLGEMTDPKMPGLVSLLVKAAGDKSELNREAALLGLADTRDAQAVAALREALKDKSQEVRLMAACLLTEFQDAAGLEELKAATRRYRDQPKSAGYFEIEMLLASLERITGKSFGEIPMSQMLFSDGRAAGSARKREQHLLNSWIAWWDWVPPSPLDWSAFNDSKGVLLTDRFAETIKDLPNEQQSAAVKRLQLLLKSPEVEIRRRAALTLGNLQDNSGVPTMIADFATAKGHDRDNVAVALRVLKDPRAIPVLRDALKDKSPYIRNIALAALGELKATTAYDDIVAHLSDLGDEGAQRDKLDCMTITPATSACYALGALGDRRAIPLLIDVLENGKSKSAARQALELLTNEKFGADAVRWREWWNRQGK